jgi:competence protein CoiA
MLKALIGHQPITTVQYTKEELLKLRKSSPQFLCPHCSAPLILRIGNIKTPHFAHSAKNSCPYQSRKETPVHIWSKALLYKRLTQLYEGVELEYYLKDLRQIPDLFLNVKGESIAIEIQCSTIPLSEVKYRTEGYIKEKIHPLWILTQPVAGSIPLKLTTFQQGFIRFSPHLNYFLLHFEPAKKSFTIFPNLTPVTTNLFLHSKRIVVPLNDFTLPISIAPPGNGDSTLITDWMKHRQKWIQNKIHYSSLRDDRFLKEVYEEGDTFVYLPLFVGLPVLPHTVLYKSHPVEWQYYLWKDVMKKKQYFTKEMLGKAIARRVARGQIEMRDLPLSDGGRGIQMVMNDYLTKLEELEMVRKGEGKAFTLSIGWKCPHNFTEFQQHERDFFSNWKHILKKH